MIGQSVDEMFDTIRVSALNALGGDNVAVEQWAKCSFDGGVELSSDSKISRPTSRT